MSSVKDLNNASKRHFKPGNLFVCIIKHGNYVSVLEKEMNNDFRCVFIPTGTTMVFLATHNVELEHNIYMKKSVVRAVLVILNGKLAQVWEPDMHWQTC